MKSEVAMNAGKTMNPDLNAKVYTERMNPKTEELFNNDFWKGLDGVLNALDNVKAR